MADVAKLGLLAIGADTGTGRSIAGGGLFTPETTASPLVLLMQHIRGTIKATLPEILEIPETVDVSILNIETQQLITPILVMLGKTPRPGQSAVNDITQILTFDFIYVTVSVSADLRDVQTYVRNQLVRLQRALLADYRQGGLANDTRVQEVPVDHENAYKKIFAEQAQPVTALFMTMEFDIIEQLV